MTDKLVYFIRPIGHAGPIKIGCSVMPQKRLRDVEIWSPLKLEILATAPGEHFEERSLHHRFAAHRLHGEWFSPNPELLALIEGVIATGRLPKIRKPACIKDWKVIEANARGKMPRRNNVARLSKYKLTKRVNAAEQRAFGFADRFANRPAEVVQIIASYQGFASPLPTDEQVAILESYIAELAKLPAADRSMTAWRQWIGCSQSGRAA